MNKTGGNIPKPASPAHNIVHHNKFPWRAGYSPPKAARHISQVCLMCNKSSLSEPIPIQVHELLPLFFIESCELLVGPALKVIKISLCWYSAIHCVSYLTLVSATFQVCCSKCFSASKEPLLWIPPWLHPYQFKPPLIHVVYNPSWLMTYMRTLNKQNV